MYECAVSLISSKNIIWKMKKIKNGNLIQNTGVNVGGKYYNTWIGIRGFR